MNPSDLAMLLLTQAWQLALLAGGVLLFNRLLAKDRPHLAHALWLVVLLKCVTPPLWSSTCGVFCWLQPRLELTRLADPQELISTLEPTLDVPPAARQEAVVSLLPAARAVDEVEYAGGAIATRLDWPALLVGVWLWGAALSLTIATLRWCSFWRELRRCRRRDDPALATHLLQLCRRLHVGRRVRLLITESRIGPAVIGLFRPTILLPAAIVSGKSPAELEPILAHELLHVRRGDLWLAAAQVQAQSLWWFHPLVWIANRLLTREAERCCDEQVLAELRCEPARYARSLLDVLQLKQQLVAVPAFPGVRPVDVTSSRLERIMRLGHGCRPRTPWWCWLVLLLAAALALPGAAFVVGAKEPPGQLAPPRTQSAAVSPPTASAPAEAPADSSPRFTRVYEVRDLIQRLMEELKTDESTAKEDLRGHVLGFAGLKDLQLAWDGDRLIASHNQAGLERITAAVDQLREFGVRQIVLTVRMISGPPELLEKLPVRWSAADGTLPQSGAKPPSTVSAAFDFRPLPLPAEAKPGDTWTQATSIVEKNMPVLYALIDRAQTRTIVGAAQDDRETNILFAPKVTVFNGQRATVMDARQRPFVVGLRPVATSDPQAPPAFEPQIRVVDEGTTLRMRPLLQGADRLRLDYEFTLASVRSVETAKIPQGAGRAPLTVQVPEVASVRFSSSLNLPLGQTLAVGALTKQGVKPTAMIVLLEASEIDLAAENQAAKSSLDGSSIAPSPRAAHPARYLEADVQYFPAPPPRQTPTVADRLAAKISIAPCTMPLDEAMASIGSIAGVTIWLDPRGLAAEGVTPKTEVTVQRQTAPISLNTLLNQLLDPLALAHCIDNDAVRVTSRSELRGKAYTKVYRAADLVDDVAGKDAKPNFDPLMHQIVHTISPSTWVAAGGPGSIAAYDANLSLVVSQTQQVHDQIADFLARLRERSQQQVKFDLQLLATPVNVFERTGLDFEIHSADSDTALRHALLTREQAVSLVKAAGANPKSERRLTVLHGEQGDLDLAIDGAVHKVNFKLQPRIQEGRNSVRVNVAVGEGQLSATSRGTLINCAAGQSLLVDVTDSVPVIGIPVLSKLPQLGPLFRQSPPEGSRVLLLVTPTIRAGEESAPR